jgi:hypothetical protein
LVGFFGYAAFFPEMKQSGVVFLVSLTAQVAHETG